MSGPLKLAICSWCYGIGGGAARMESYYYRLYDRTRFEPHLVSLVQRPEAGPEYDSSIPYIQVNQKDRFSHLLTILEDFDVIQFQGGFDPLVCEAADYIRKPHVLLEVLHNIEQGRRFPNIDGTVCVSSAVAAKQVPGASLRVIPNGINLKEFPFDESSKSQEKIILLQLARRAKLAVSLDEISAELLALDPRIEIWIVSDSPGVSTDRVKFLPRTEDVAALYRAAHFTVLLSKDEPFGLVVLESMSCGTPVISSNSGALPELITDSSVGILVDPTDRQQVITTITEALKLAGTEGYRQLSRAGRQHVEDKFSIEACVRSYEDYILELYGRKVLMPYSAKPKPDRTPPNALVGEALYDAHSNDLEMLSRRLELLTRHGASFSGQSVLENAHMLGRYLKIKRAELFPPLFDLYMFCCGDRTEYTCGELLKNLDLVKQHGIFDAFYEFLRETREEFPDRWREANER